MMSKRVLVPEDWRPSLFRNLSAGDSSNRRSLVGILTDASKRLPFLHVVSVEDFCGTTVENLIVRGVLYVEFEGYCDLFIWP